MKITVGFQTLEVKPMRVGNSSDEDAYGTFRPFEGVIEISSDSAPHTQGEALIHETLHAVWRAMAMTGKVDEETAVRAFGRGLAQVVRDNPHWVEAVQRALRGADLFTKDTTKP